MSEEEQEETQENQKKTSDTSEEDPEYANVGAQEGSEEDVERRVVHVACRREDEDGGNCGSDKAVVTEIPNSNDVHYECKGCGATWTVSMGGPLNLT